MIASAADRGPDWGSDAHVVGCVEPAHEDERRLGAGLAVELFPHRSTWHWSPAQLLQVVAAGKHGVTVGHPEVHGSLRRLGCGDDHHVAASRVPAWEVAVVLDVTRFRVMSDEGVAAQERVVQQVPEVGRARTPEILGLEPFVCCRPLMSSHTDLQPVFQGVWGKPTLLFKG